MTATARASTLLALGTRNLARVGLYRLGLRSGLHPVQRLRASIPGEDFLRARQRPGQWPQTDRIWLSATRYFDWLTKPLPSSGMPDWLDNPFGNHSGGRSHDPWWRITDFGSGDIKGLWELSRMGWAPALAAGAATRVAGASEQLVQWLEDWCGSNPPYLGPNWKCGQEASIRVMHLVAAAIVLDEDRDPLPGLVELIAIHLARIAPTMGYALGQDNNHGTSEAAALFVGGSLLEMAGDRRGRAWCKMGRRWLEERATHLIERDGSFSQYSVNYHRLMLDSYCFAQSWCQRRGLPGFSRRLRERLRAATLWLHALVDPATGDAPNIGASDGARLFPVAPTGYRDFRPSLQWAAAAFADACAYGEGPWDANLIWFGPERPAARLPSPTSHSFDDGGWHVLVNDRTRLVMRYPRFRFRPSQADMLHVDLTVDGTNLLRDAGTRSYNAIEDPEADFAATRFHNTINFDGRDQMPRLSRFLFGGWLRASGVAFDAETISASAGYTDAQGCSHHRHVTLSDHGFTCTDRIDGPFAQAKLRWRMPAGQWRLAGRRLEGERLALAIDGNAEIGEVALREGREARHYWRDESVTVLEVEINSPGMIVTTGRF